MKHFVFLLSLVFIFVSLTAQEAPAEAPAADENQPAAEQEAAPAAETPAEQPAPAEEPAKEEAPAEQPAKEEAPAEQPAPAEEPAKEEAPAADATAEAPAEAPAEEAAPAAAEPADPRHSIYFKPQLSASYMHNYHVSGKTDGHYFQTDANIVFNYKYKEGMHEVLTDLNWKEGVSKTPAFNGWVIANDLFKIDFRYNLMFHKIAGYYLKAGLETHFFPGYDYRSDDYDYVVSNNETRNSDGKKRKFKTAKPGKPLYLTEGTGIFVRPVESEEANLEIYAGLSAREVWVGNTLALDDDDTTEEIELKELNDVYELGAEAGLTLKGFLKDRVVGYDFLAKVTKPFYMPDDTKANYSEDGTADSYSELDSLQFETRLRLDFNVYKYVAFNYELNVKRDYAVVRDWQVSNALYLSIFYELDKKFN
ncbi:hypothetical protein J6Z19_08035 [bacterium]|nr:hypothetical protein [bacterium]